MRLLNGGNKAILVYLNVVVYCLPLWLGLFFLGNLTDDVLRPPLLTPSMLSGREVLGGPIRVRGTECEVWGAECGVPV